MGFLFDGYYIMNTKLQLCIDLETLGKYDNAVVTRIAITPFFFDEANITFNELVERSLLISLDQDEQIHKGRVIDPATVEWWEEKDEALKIASYYKTDNDVSVEEAFDQISTYLKKWRYSFMNSHLWARNVFFENAKIQSLSEMVYGDGQGAKVLNCWNWLDTKTFNYMMTGGKTTKFNPVGLEGDEFVYHQADHDSAFDALRIIQLWNGIGYKENGLLDE